MIDITGIPAEVLLYCLYTNSKPIGLGYFMEPPAGTITIEKCKECLERNDEVYVSDINYYLDYFFGHPIKITIPRIPNSNGIYEINEYLFDRDNGEGACANAVKTARILVVILNPDIVEVM